MSSILAETTTSAANPKESGHSDATFDFEQETTSSSQMVLEHFVEK